MVLLQLDCNSTIHRYSPDGDRYACGSISGLSPVDMPYRARAGEYHIEWRQRRHISTIAKQLISSQRS